MQGWVHVYMMCLLPPIVPQPVMTQFPAADGCVVAMGMVFTVSVMSAILWSLRTAMSPPAKGFSTSKASF